LLDLFNSNIEIVLQGGDKLDRKWFGDKEIKQITSSSKDRIATFFEVENKAVTAGHILHKLKIDHGTIKRVMNVMVKHGLLEVIETSNCVVYRRKRE